MLPNSVSIPEIKMFEFKSSKQSLIKAISPKIIEKQPIKTPVKRT